MRYLLVVLSLAVVFFSGCDEGGSSYEAESSSSATSVLSQDVIDLPDSLGSTPTFPNDLKDI